MRILMIHGRAQGGQDPDRLKLTWRDSLVKGFQSARIPFPNEIAIDFPFYGDRLDEIVDGAKLPTPDDVVAKGAPETGEFQEFLKAALEEIRTRAEVTDDEVAAQLEPTDATEKGIQNWGWVRAIARVLDRHLTDVADFTIEKFLEDVFLYVNRPAVTREINSIIESKLTDEPTIVVGHSLGSVVGYNVIRDNLSSRNLQKYITVGCPLGITAVNSRLGMAENPLGDSRWYNAFDKRDIVALNPLDDQHFPALPPVLNNDGVDNSTDNRHGIVGYLDDPNVAREIAAVIG